MPICTTCTAAVPFLYTVYESAYNLRLEECVGTLLLLTLLGPYPLTPCPLIMLDQTHCHAFADPYVEHDTLALVLDLILLKRGVFRHLLYNRATEPRRETGKATNSPEKGMERNDFADATTNGANRSSQKGPTLSTSLDAEREKVSYMS